MAIVIDASVATGWLLQSQADELTNAAEAALTEDSGWVPSHFGIELARGLRSLERRGLLTSQMVDDALKRLGDVPLQQDGDDALEHVAKIVTLARQYTLRVADAAYLELALRIDLPLATRDRALAMAATRAGAALFKP
jgi:predicted nucleic acid-binding protein